MADNVQLNPGVGGAILRTLQDADGLDYPVGVFAYATTLSPGANAVQIVDATHGLPVTVVGTVELAVGAEVGIASGSSVGVSGTVTAAQSTAANLNATVVQGGSWTVGLEAGAEVKTTSGSTTAATQSGLWTVGVSGTVTVAQSTAANLKATVTQSGTWTVGLSGGTTVGISGTVATTQSGMWTVGLSGGTTVGVSGTVATTQSGAWTVGLAAGAEVKLAANAKVGLNIGTELVGKVAAGVDGSTVYSGTTALTRKFAKISASTSGNNVIVAAVPDSRIRVLRWGLTANGDVGIKWRSGASTDLTGARPLTKYASAGGSYCPVGVFQTAKGEALNLNLDAAVAVGGEITYVEVPDGGAPSGPEGGTGIDP